MLVALHPVVCVDFHGLHFYPVLHPEMEALSLMQIAKQGLVHHYFRHKIHIIHDIKVD